MVIKMTIQSYCCVDKQTMICDNVVLWDGNTDTWQPPTNHLMLPQATTPAKDWVWDNVGKVWTLSVFGFGQIGFTWDGTYLVTTEPEPENPPVP